MLPESAIFECFLLETKENLHLEVPFLFHSGEKARNIFGISSATFKHFQEITIPPPLVKALSQLFIRFPSPRNDQPRILSCWVSASLTHRGFHASRMQQSLIKEHMTYEIRLSCYCAVITLYHDYKMICASRCKMVPSAVIILLSLYRERQNCEGDLDRVAMFFQLRHLTHS